MRLQLPQVAHERSLNARLRCSEVVVRGRIELPTFRFSGGFARPGESTIDRLNRPNDVSEHQDVQD
jgi:hypothetical protein